MFETLLIEAILIEAIRGFLSYFSNPVSEFPYHSELIDEDSTLSASGARDGFEFTIYPPPPHDIT
jgi:hypothetical protein